jgi:lysosomal alpha-mannosidase
MSKLFYSVVLTSGLEAQSYGEIGTLVTRMWKGAKNLEVEWTAGPIMDEGKEVVLQYKTGLESGDMFYTDSNGREIQPRRRNYSPTWPLNVTEPVAGNYYPITAAIYIAVSQLSIPAPVLPPMIMFRNIGSTAP